MRSWPLAVAPFVVKVLVLATSPYYFVTQVVFSPQHLAERLTPYPLPTKDGGVLRTIGDARAYMLALSKEREWLDHWKPAYRLLVGGGAGAAALTQQVQLALSRDGQLDVEALEHMRALGGGDKAGN
jgi:hypothetical protein